MVGGPATVPTSIDLHKTTYFPKIAYCPFVTFLTSVPAKEAMWKRFDSYEAKKAASQAEMKRTGKHATATYSHGDRVYVNGDGIQAQAPLQYPFNSAKQSAAAKARPVISKEAQRNTLYTTTSSSAHTSQQSLGFETAHHKQVRNDISSVNHFVPST